MIVESNMNDVWARRAARAAEPETTKPRKPMTLAELEQPKPGSAIAIAGLTAEDVRRLTGNSLPPVVAADKAGIPATQLKNVISTWILVTPEMAARWLKSNFRNRPMSDAVVLAYARDMATARWQPTHQGIAFNELDQLIDGQHRLAAVVRVGQPVRMMVTFGLPVKIKGTELTIMDCVDRGRPRSVADQLKVQHGLKNAAQIAGISAALAHLCVGEKMRKMSVGQTLDTYRAFQPGVDFVIKHRSKESGLKSVAVTAAFAFAFAVPDADVKKRFARLNAGGEQGPLKLLFEFLRTNESLVMMKNLHRGIVELVAHAIWLDMTQPDSGVLEMKPDEWLKAVEFFRAQQAGPVAKVAALFQVKA